MLASQAMAQSNIQLYSYTGDTLGNGKIAGYKEMHLSTAWYFYKKNPDGSYDQSKIDPEITRQRAEGITTTGPVCLDIEEFRFTEGEWEFGQQQFISALKINRKSLPNQNRIGMYRYLPRRDYWTPVKYHRNPMLPANIAAMESWQAHNKLFKSNRRDSLSRRSWDGVADYVDVIYPSIYQFYPDLEAQLVYVKANIKEARKYNKPIIVWMWSQFHDETNAYVGDESIEAQLSLLEEMEVEGVVFYRRTDAPPSFFEILHKRWGYPTED
jgi:hypothetical protein